jgi:hypothetical protein
MICLCSKVEVVLGEPDGGCVIVAQGVDLVAPWMRPVAGMWLYRLNAFRALGLDEVVGQEVVRARRGEAVAALASGSALPRPADPASIGAVPLKGFGEENFVRLAVRNLEDPIGQLVHELFWPWGEQDLTCGCQPYLHRVHDRAVLAHLKALEWDLSLEMEMLENSRSDFDPHSVGPLIDTQWVAATMLWATVLASDDLWLHIRHRTSVLGIRPRAAVVQGLRAQLPHALVASAADLATISSDPHRLIAAAHRWSVAREVVDDELTAAAEVVHGRLEESLVSMPRAAESAEFGAYLKHFIKDLELHAALAPVPRTLGSLRDRAAVVVTDCAAPYLGDRATPRGLPEAWFGVALRLAVSPDVRETVRERQRNALTQHSSVLARLFRWSR